LWVDQGAAKVSHVEWTRPDQLMTGYFDFYAKIGFAAGASFDAWLQIIADAIARRDG
jgi:hypothetical protein